MVGQYADYTVADVLDEIRSTKELIGSLPIMAENYVNSKNRLEHKLESLETVLDAKQAEEQTRQYQEDLKFLDESKAGNALPSGATAPLTTYQVPQNSFSDPLLPSSGFSPYGDYQQHIPDNHFASDSAVGAHGIMGVSPVLWNMSSLGDSSDRGTRMSPPAQASMGPSPGSVSTSTPDQEASLPSTPMPERSHNSRKRPRESLNLSSPTHAHVAKALRPTPSPAGTLPTTPSSVDSFDFPDNPEFYRLMGGNPKEDMREMREEQKAQEKMLQEKLEQERRDEAFARQLMEEEKARSTAPDMDQTWGFEPLVPRPSPQTLIGAPGSLHHLEPSPWLPSLTSTMEQQSHLAPDWTASQEIPGRHMSARPSTKLPSNEPVFNTNDFIDLGSSDEFDGLPGDAGSDLVEVNPPRSNRKTEDVKAQRNLPWMSSSAQDKNAGAGARTGVQAPASTSFMNNATPYSYNNLYEAGVGYGGTNVYNAPSDSGTGSSSWANIVGQVGQDAAYAARIAYNAAYNLVDSHIASLPTSTPGYGSSSYGYGPAGSSSNPHFVPDVDADNLSQPLAGVFNDVLNNRSLNVDDPKNRDLVDRYMDRYNYLTNDPTRTASEIKSLLENIRPDEDLPPENREGTPDAMTYPLMEHQKLGLAWMKAMEEGSTKGGILADDMGLGKTIQALALMVSRRSSDPRRKTTLIVAPVALMKQWEREIQRKLKPGRENRLTSYILHGSNRQAPWEHLRTFDVVLTTFGTLANEFKRKEGIDMQKRVNPNWRPISKADHLSLLGDECKWYRVIIDEAQCIKNRKTKAALGAAQLQSVTRFCMTGTPMMNNVNELYSLIHFLRIKPYNMVENFNRDFSRPLRNYDPDAKDEAMKKLQALLKAILLRRTKLSKIDGKPIIDLPKRTNHHEHAVFSEDEEAFYRALETQTQLQFNRYLKAGTVGRNYSNVLVLLLRLRQACCHPHLIKDHGLSPGVTNVSVTDMMELARQLSDDVVARIKEQSALNDQGALECPVCIDMAENATIFIPCGHCTCSECFARISDPSQAIIDGDDAEGRGVDIKCPNCRGKIIPTKVIDHTTFKRVYMPEEAERNAADSEADVETTDESDSGSGSNSTGDTDEDDDDSIGSLKDFIADDNEESEGEATQDTDMDESDRGTKAGPEGKSSLEGGKRKASKNKKSQRKKGKGKKKAPLKTLAQLKKESSGSAEARRKYLNKLAKEWEPSGKVEKVMEILQATQDRDDGEKTIIFSQFTSLLDLLEVPIYRKQWGYKRYDGSMTSNARNEAVIEFTDSASCKIMLVSLKAGNSGLNLVAASQVIILDPFWNPYIEEQAVDRAHRIGQMRPVHVHRILVQNTVEDRILLLQEKKRALIEGALDEKASQNIGRLGERELAFLFVS
jgi:SNF2 family DNA or RNA helicase